MASELLETHGGYHPLEETRYSLVDTKFKVNGPFNKPEEKFIKP
jgi:hypothetical protein